MTRLRFTGGALLRGALLRGALLRGALLGSALAMASTSTGLGAAEGGEFAELVHARHEHFEDMGAATKVFRDQLRGDAPFDTPTQVEAAGVIVVLAPQITTWFPTGSGPDDGYDTDALAYIWRNRAKFDRIAGELGPKAEALERAAASGDRSAVLQAFRDVGGTCKSCHDSYRAD